MVARKKKEKEMSLRGLLALETFKIRGKRVKNIFFRKQGPVL
jgi:hypothetical protein